MYSLKLDDRNCIIRHEHHYIVVCSSYQITRPYTSEHKMNETYRSQWMKSNTFWCRRMFLFEHGSWNEEMNGRELQNLNKLHVHLNENYIKNKCITKWVCVWPFRHQYTSASTVNYTPCSLSTFQTSTNQHSPPFHSAQYIDDTKLRFMSKIFHKMQFAK